MHTIEEKLKELRRELATRQRVYPTWIQRGQISQKDADQRVAVLKEVIADYEKMQASQKATQVNMFNPDHQK